MNTQPYGGVVPEGAARAHVDYIDVMVKRALEMQPNLTFQTLMVLRLPAVGLDWWGYCGGDDGEGHRFCPKHHCGGQPS